MFDSDLGKNEGLVVRRRAVLIVDDEPAIRRFLRASLAAHGYSVHEASTGEEALQVVPAVHPDVITVPCARTGNSRGPS